MALTTFEQPVGGSVTGNSFLDSYISRGAAGGVQPTQPGGAGFGRPASPFDHFRTKWSSPITYSPSPLNPRFQPSEGDARTAGFFSQPFIDQQSLREGAEKAQKPFIDQQKDRRETERNKLRDLAMRAGLIGENFLPSELDAIWQSAVDEAEAASGMGDRMSPWDILQFWAGDPRQARNYGVTQPSAPELEDIEGVEPEPDRTVTSTNTSTALTDAKTAKVVIRQGLRSQLGRAPTDDEIQQFTSFLNANERENPTITETETTYKGDGSSQTSESVTEGGAMSPTAAAESFTDDNFEDEAFAYRMGTEGASVIQQLVGSLV